MHWPQLVPFLTVLVVAISVVAGNADPGSADPPLLTTIPHWSPHQRSQAVNDVLEASTDDQERFYAVRGLAISGYTLKSAEALTVIASDCEYGVTTRNYAAMGLRNFSSVMPGKVRRTILDQLMEALYAEKGELPGGVIRTLIGWGVADKIQEVLGQSLQGHPLEIEILQNVSVQKDAVSRLWALYEEAPDTDTERGWFRRAQIGRALIVQRDRRGIDLLLECLTVDGQWRIDNSSTIARERMIGSFRQSLHNLFIYLSNNFCSRFGYVGSHTWTPDLSDSITRMAAWWKDNRHRWNFVSAE